MRDKVIILGTVLVLGAGFALWRMTRDISSVEAEPPKANTETARTEPTEDAASAPMVTTKRDPEVAPADRGNRDAPGEPRRWCDHRSRPDRVRIQTVGPAGGPAGSRTEVAERAETTTASP